MEKIKLVIWDLDETFWGGTLSEGEINIDKRNIDIVTELSRRGIINSISSKNDYNEVKRKLSEAGVWDYFIFPEVNWQPKGCNVKHIIENCQLRSPNVLFIDDNISNRKEVEHYNPGINTLGEFDIPNLLDMPELRGKDDSALSRLKQYKILEEKARVKEHYSDNHAFLLESDIRIQFLYDAKLNRERIQELISRTNQLNFTKKRLTEKEIDDMLNDPNLTNACIRVVDKFGDYGICGFYSINKEKFCLEHFLFSCRILNLGIESYIYEKLGRPDIKVIPPIAGTLVPVHSVDWVKEIGEQVHAKESKSDCKGKMRVLLLGGCDLEQMCHYMDDTQYEIIKEFNYPNKNGVAVHREHTAYLKAIFECNNEEKAEICSLPFCDSKMLDSAVFEGGYDVVVYSVLMNYLQNVYKNYKSPYRVAYGSGYADFDLAMKRMPMNEYERHSFLQKFQFEGQQTPEGFLNDLEWLINHINTPVVFINGAEIKNVSFNENGAYERHKVMNSALETFVKKHSDKCKILDVRKYVKSRSEIGNNIRHYQRPVYIKMAEDLMILLGNNDVRIRKTTIFKNWIKWNVKRFKKSVRRILFM